MSRACKAVKAGPKERTIELKIRFFTDGLDSRKGYILPKYGWVNGSIQVDRNDSHGIVPGNPLPFNSLMEIPTVIEKVLINHEIKLHNARKMAKYIES